MNYKFLQFKDILTVHQKQVNRFGGIHGVRDISLLASALATPQSTFGGQYLHASIYEMAAAYSFHIIKNHPFLDGNKRTGLLTGLLFLRNNGYTDKMPQDIGYELAMGIATSQITKEEATNIFAMYVKK